jgi:hypothetical protein
MSGSTGSKPRWRPASASSFWWGRTGCGTGSGPRPRWRSSRYFGPPRRRPAPADLPGPAPRHQAGHPPALSPAVPRHAMERDGRPAREPARADPRTGHHREQSDLRGLPVRRPRRLRAGSGAAVLRPPEGDPGHARLLRHAQGQPDRPLARDQRQQRLRQVLVDERWASCRWWIRAGSGHGPGSRPGAGSAR